MDYRYQHCAKVSASNYFAVRVVVDEEIRLYEASSAFWLAQLVRKI